MACAQIMKRPAFANMGEAVAWEMAHTQVPYELPITLPEAAWRDLPDAMAELCHMIRAAQRMLDHLLEVMSQSLNSDPGIVATVELAKRGLEHVSEHEGTLLDNVEMVLRTAVSQMMKNKIAREAERKSA